MITFKTTVFFIAAGFALGATSCKKDSDTPENNPPRANAGLSQVTTLPADSATLTGSGSDTDGNVISYLWSQVSGPATALIAYPGSPNTKVKNLSAAGTYVFQLMVTDNKGTSGVDTASIIVNPNPIKTLTLQPNNNSTELSIENQNGVDGLGLTGQSIQATAWTSGGNPWITRGLLKFDLSTIPTSATIISANLYLYSNPAPNTGNLVDANAGSANAFLVQQVTANWALGTMTWFNQPTVTTANQIVIPGTTQSQLDLNLNVTDMLTSMVHTNANYGFELKLQTETTLNSRIFVSSHNATYPDKHPKLVVVYQ